MKNLQIGIEDDNGTHIPYNIDYEILNGLYVTFEEHKVTENCKNFNINIDAPKPNSFSSKISKRDNIGIVTIKVYGQTKIQFLVGYDLNIMELLMVDDTEIIPDFKVLIQECYKLVNIRTLNDFLK